MFTVRICQAILLLIVSIASVRGWSGLPDGREIYMTHFHKSGGTSLCELAILNSNVTEKATLQTLLKHNCNAGGNGPNTVSPKNKYGWGNENIHCDQVKSFAPGGLGLLSNEHWMQQNLFAEGCREQILHAVIMRDPIGRIQSNQQFHEIPEQRILRAITRTVMEPRRVYAASTSMPRRLLTIVSGTPCHDNFHIRTLLGKDVFFRPLGDITNADLEKAKKIIDDHYEMVIVLEEWDQHMVQLRDTFGWYTTNLPRDLHRVGSYHRLPPISQTTLAKLRKLNALDIELYEYVKVKAAQLSAAANARMALKMNIAAEGAGPILQLAMGNNNTIDYLRSHYPVPASAIVARNNRYAANNKARSRRAKIRAAKMAAGYQRIKKANIKPEHNVVESP